MKTFTERVKAVVAGIPRGKTMTYGEVARRAGNAKAARAVGMIMSRNYDPKVPCHRVIRSDGAVGDYNRGGAGEKAELLMREGAVLSFRACLPVGKLDPGFGVQKYLINNV
ncbi:MAG: MGMT family protein [Patescibacteria group bacterium]|nr:MGMT family protein [Patescibacteria group bacterium]